jgi:outer membrane protein assembly factor BamB
VAVASKAGIMQAFRRKDGKRLWRTMLTETPSIAGNPGAAAAYDDNVFKGVLYQGFNSDPGPSLTTQLYLAVINGDLSLFPQFLQAIFVGTTGNISAVDACTGKILWSVGYPSPTFGAPTYANGLVYQAWLDGTIRIFNAKTGDVVSSFMSPYIDLGPPYDLFSTHYPISVSIPIVDGNLFISLGNDLGPIGGLMVYGLP